jgi:hypothetical protein
MSTTSHVQIEVHFNPTALGGRAAQVTGTAGTLRLISAELLQLLTIEFNQGNKMQISSLHRQMQRILFFVLSLIAAAPGSATQPLFDRYTDGVHTGNIFPSKCCYVELPDNERIREIRRRDLQKCSAVGGPVGMFKLEAGKLWLTGLADCGGEIALQEFYPNIKTPVVAEWLTGTFKTTIDYQCSDTAGHTLYAVTQQLIVEKGVVQSVTETHNDNTCIK